MLRVSAPPSRCSGGRAQGDVATPGICTLRGWLRGGDRAAESAGGNPAICTARGLRRREGVLSAVFRPGHSSVTASQPPGWTRTVQGCIIFLEGIPLLFH